MKDYISLQHVHRIELRDKIEVESIVYHDERIERYGLFDLKKRILPKGFYDQLDWNERPVDLKSMKDYLIEGSKVYYKPQIRIHTPEGVIVCRYDTLTEAVTQYDGLHEALQSIGSLWRVNSIHGES